MARPAGQADATERSTGPSARYVAHVGFTLVALFDAFIVITVLNSGAPGWLIVAAGVLIAVAGHFVLRAVRDRFAVPSREPLIRGVSCDAAQRGCDGERGEQPAGAAEKEHGAQK